MYVVYVLRSLKDSNRFYVGLTVDLEQRLADHNEGKSGYTAKYRPWDLIVDIRFKSRAKAEAFEHYPKSGSGRAFCRRHF
jgi:predicted GIY-YIG superfamily endonuclease